MSRIYCPTGCGSKTFRVQRRGAIVVDVQIDEYTGDMVLGEGIAEAGHGHAWVSCECGHTWKSKAQALEGIAESLEGR